jgi:hypothetical protein
VPREVVNTFAFEERFPPISERFFVLITSQHVGPLFPKRQPCLLEFGASSQRRALDDSGRGLGTTVDTLKLGLRRASQIFGGTDSHKSRIGTP